MKKWNQAQQKLIIKDHLDRTIRLQEQTEFAELLKLRGHRLTEEIFNLTSRIWRKEEIPMENIRYLPNIKKR